MKAGVRPLRLYQHTNGIWRGVIERNGEARWFSLNTRDERRARAKWRDYCAMFEDRESDGGDRP